MNLRTPRRRIVFLLILALVSGAVIRHLATDTFTLTTQRMMETVCPPPRNLVCAPLYEGFYWLLPLLVTALGILVLIPVLPWVVAWALRPMRELVPVIAQVGPQNLGYRIGTTGGRRDEFTALCSAVDEMMDRIKAGYEGQRRFAANASHELRTPLAVQRTLVEVGMAQPLTGEQLALLTAQLLQANERNERLVDGLLVLSEADQGLVSRSPQRLDRIGYAVLTAHRSAADAAGVSLTADLQPVVVYGEQVLLERLVTNLVQNAIKYNHPQGTVHLAVGRAPALMVANSGQVIPPGAVAELFEPFKRLAADRIDHSGGAGLGLAIARSITRAHDGTIMATALPDGGLRVEVRLPT